MYSGFTIDVYSHFIKVTGYTRQGKDHLKDFAKRRNGQKGLVKIRGRFRPEIVRVFAASTKNRREFRFHRHQLDEVLKHIKNVLYSMNNVQVRYHAPPTAQEVEFNLNPKFELRDIQKGIVDYMSSDSYCKVVNAQTGLGKTVCAATAVGYMGYRTVLVVKGMYVDKWIGDCKEILGLKPGELLVIRGSADLKRLIDLGLSNQLEAKFIIITSKTMFNFYKAYEESNGESDEYGCKPDEFYGVLKAGVRLIDEVHQEFHANFRQDLYTHVQTTIDLSATIETDDPFINNMYKVKYPHEIRYKAIPYNKYIAVEAIHYTFHNPQLIRYERRGMESYSHVEFENSLMKHKKTLENYLVFIGQLVSERFQKHMENGQRCLIFCATVDLCQIVAKYLKELFPQFTTNSYTQENPYEELISNDISVSTIQSAGTAVDIPGLKVCLMTNAVGSKQANEQAVGRLRQLKNWPDVTPLFLYLVCDDIEKHIEYHERKKRYFADKVLTHISRDTKRKI